MDFSRKKANKKHKNAFIKKNKEEIIYSRNKEEIKKQRNLARDENGRVIRGRRKAL